MFCISKHLRHFFANLPLFQIRRFCVKFGPQKLRSGKSFDKYQVWLGMFSVLLQSEWHAAFHYKQLNSVFEYFSEKVECINIIKVQLGMFPAGWKSDCYSTVLAGWFKQNVQKVIYIFFSVCQYSKHDKRLSTDLGVFPAGWKSDGQGGSSGTFQIALLTS